MTDRKATVFNIGDQESSQEQDSPAETEKLPMRQAPALHSDGTSWWVAGPGWYDLRHCFDMHLNYLEHGAMLPDLNVAQFGPHHVPAADKA
jgi:hypothetical protein